MTRKKHLRSRLTLFFLIASFPAVVISVGAIVVIDRMVKEEIAQRADDTFAAVTLGLDAEKDRVERALLRIARDDSIRSLADAVDHEAAVDRAEGIAPLLAAEAGLPLFAVVAASGPRAGTIISSAHLPTAAGDAAPRFSAPRLVRGSTVGFAQELVAGNPPTSVPAIVAVHTTPDRSGRRALVLYGGTRLDGRLLQVLARTGGASLILRAPGDEPRRFGRESMRGSLPVRNIALPSLAGATPDDEGARIVVAIDRPRLEEDRRRFVFLAAGLAISIFAGALVAGTWLSRPITGPIEELSRAAVRVGAGELDVRVEHDRDDEVGELVVMFNQMVTEIADSRQSLARAERIAAWRDAARQVAHEIKNPLTPMQMAMETLRKAYRVKHADLDAIVDESTQAVLDEVRSLSRIVSEFSEFARLPKPRLEQLSALELLETTSRLYGSPPESITVELDSARLAAADLPMVSADRDQLGRALINLVKNAIEAMQASGGIVLLDAEANERGGKPGVTLRVSDNGPGMTDEVKGRLFKPYFTTKKTGTGLGLAIVEQIVAEHAGAIDVTTSPGAGTTFDVWLPAA